MTERDYVAFCNGYKLKDAKEWERTRMLAMFMFNNMSTKPISDPRRLFKIPLVDGAGAPEMTKADIKAMFEELTPK